MFDLFSVDFWAITIFAVAVLIALVLTLREEWKYRRRFSQRMEEQRVAQQDQTQRAQRQRAVERFQKV